MTRTTVGASLQLKESNPNKVEMVRQRPILISATEPLVEDSTSQE